MKHLRIKTLLFYTIILLLLAGSSFPLIAQSDTVFVIQKTQPIDDKVEAVDFRIPKETEIEKYRNDKRFDYVENKKNPDLSWLQKISQWFKDLFNKAEFNPDFKVPSFSFEPLFWILAVALVIMIVFFIFKFFKINPKALFGKKKMDAPDINIYTEDVNEMNFDTLIANAISNRDYRLATRYIYLLSLKNMSDKSIITWKPNKTNYIYQYEIGNAPLRSKFIDSTYIFEYIWYGEFPLDESKFEMVKEKLNELIKLIENER